jgi:hypothetical protein
MPAKNRIFFIFFSGIAFRVTLGDAPGILYGVLPYVLFEVGERRTR